MPLATGQNYVLTLQNKNRYYNNYRRFKWSLILRPVKLIEVHVSWPEYPH
jgi:hypothetical protein